MVCPQPQSQPCYPKEFYQQILCFLSQIKNAIEPAGGGIRYEWSVLCDPNTGVPVLLRNSYNVPDGTLNTNTAWNIDGSAYAGVLNQLVVCGGGGGVPGGPIRYDFEVLCNPLNGLPVLVQVAYNIDGTRGAITGVNLDGTAYSGDVTLLIACSAIVGATRYGYLNLCDPNTGFPVILRAQYNTSGTQVGFVAFNLDGSAYSGNVSLLVSCASNVSTGGCSWSNLCDPTTGRVVYVKVSYNASCTPTSISAFYGDLSAYTGDPYNLVDCASLGTGENGIGIWTPNPTPNEFSANPGVGLQTVQRNLISTNALSLNPLNYPFRCMNYRFQWKEIEDPGPGSYVLTPLNLVLDDARAALQTLNLRIITFDPASGYTTPDYLYNNAGWQVTDDGGPGTFKIAWWGNAANITALLNIHTAIQASIGTHPAFNVLDAGWGDFDENNWASTHYAGTLTGGAPNPGVGNPLPDLTLAEAQNFFDAYRAAYTASRLIVTHAANQISFNYAVGVQGFGSRMDGWSYRNNPGGCPGGGVQMCTDAVNTFLPSGSYPNSYLTKPNIEETYGRLYSGGDPLTRWLLQNWDFTASFNWTWSAGGAHTSEINVKGQFNPPSSPTDMRTPFEIMLRHLGYRFVLLELRRDNEVTAGSNLSAKAIFSNVGTAPTYRNEVVSFRLYNPVSNLKFYWQSAVPASSFVAGTSTTVNVSIPIPTWFPEGSAQLAVGIASPTPVISGNVVPEILLYNDGTNGNDFWYAFPTAVKVVNTSPTAVPAIVYTADFTFASSQFLSSNSSLFQLSGTDFMIALTITSLSTAVNRGFVTKGSRATPATQEFWIGYNSATDRIEASFCNGATVYTATANNFGAVSTKTINAANPLKILVEFNNTSKILALSVNNAASNTVTGTGTIPAGSNVFRIGSDTNNNYMQGGITNVMIFKKLFTGVPASFRQMLLDPPYLKFSDLPNRIKYGMYYMWEMSEAAGNHIDSNCGRALTNNAGVGRVQVYP